MLHLNSILNATILKNLFFFKDKTKQKSHFRLEDLKVAALYPPPRTSEDGPIRSVGLALALTLKTLDLLEEAGEESLVWQGNG